MKFIDRLPTRPGRVKITLEDGSSYFATMERADDPTVEGTPLNAENLNRLASKSGAFEDGTTAHTKPVPTDAAPYAEVVEIGGMTRKCKHIYNGWLETEFEISSQYNGYSGISKFFDVPKSWYGKTICYSALVNNTSTDQYAGLGIWAIDKNGTEINLKSKSNRTIVYAGQCDRIMYSVPITDEYVSIAFGLSVVAPDSAIIWREPMVEFGDAPSEYEPYFEGLRSAPVTEVESVGVNILPFPYFNMNASHDGGNMVANADGGISLSGTPTSIIYLYLYSGAPLKGVVTLSASGTFSNASLFLTLYNANGEIIYDGETISGLTCDLDAYPLATHMEIMLKRQGNNVALSGVCYPMLNRGTTALPYAPYARKTLPIPETVQVLDGYGWGINADCYNYIDWEKRQFVKRVEKVGFDGSPDEYWMMNQFSNLSAYIIPFLNKTLKSNIICDKFEDLPHITGQVDGTVGVAVEGVDANNGGVFFGVKGLASSVEEWRNYLASNPVTVVIALDIPIITDISDILPADNLIGVEGGGTVTMVNEYGYDVPNTVTFYEGKNEVVGADTFVGDLYGTAARAEVAMDVPAWAKQPSKPTYTAAEIGAAPAGFGRGNLITAYCLSESDVWIDKINSILKNLPYGLTYRISFQDYWTVPTQICNGILWKSGESDALVRGTSYDGITIQRSMKNGVWHPWEYINPPMELGVEYRTTERMNGKAVYKKLDSSGKLLMRLDGETEWKDYVYNATNAVNDGEGNNIVTTYMTKSEAAILGRVATGTYVGREDLAQTVTIGFKPKFITAIRQINKDRFFYIAGDGTGTFHETATGFTTGYSTEEYRHPTNYAGETYTYFAIG